MTAHVFIVDSVTFDIHLRHLFAGTGAKESRVNFLRDMDGRIHSTTEKNLVSMMADGGRVREGDKILFYLQQNISGGINEGKFYGVFTAAHDGCFLDDFGPGQYLKEALGKSLTFRTLIKPHRIYAEGVTEWEALDEIKNIHSPCQMLWSLIYRKLKGNRGNTMLTIYEEERLLQLIRNKNAGAHLNCDGRQAAFDKATQKIVRLNESPPVYQGRRSPIDILPRLLHKSQNAQAFEAHLQAYIVGGIGLGTNRCLDDALLNGSAPEWIGNEVSCGVGMRRIDVMLSLLRDENRIVAPVELKCGPAEEKNTRQIQRYVNWIQQYYIPNRPGDIEPVLVAHKIDDKKSDAYRELIAGFDDFNRENANGASPLKYVEFGLKDGELNFEAVDYRG